MKRSVGQVLASKRKSVALAIFSFLMFYAFAYMLNPYDKWWGSYFSRPVTDIVSEWGFSLVFCVLISVSSIFIHEKINQFVPWIERPIKRLAIETSVNIASVVFLVFTQLFLINLLSDNSADGYSEYDNKVGYWHWLTISIFIALAISAIHTGDYLIMNWKNAALEATEHKLRAAEHKQAAAEAELQALKLQLDPHFVFNNLSVLSELILENQQLGYDYAENFSKVYRYLLLNAKKDLISLEEELKFIKAYTFLLEHRAGSGISFEICIGRELLGLKLPPLTLQLLIENAMKHNKHLKSNPLKILVRGGDNMNLLVSNSVIPLETKQQSSGIGLRNIEQRYHLLCDKTVHIKNDNHLFTVSIPLIKA